MPSQSPSLEELRSERQRMDLARAELIVRPKMLGQDREKIRLGSNETQGQCGQCPHIETLVFYYCCLSFPPVLLQLPLPSPSTHWETRLVTPRIPFPGPSTPFPHLTQTTWNQAPKPWIYWKNSRSWTQSGRNQDFLSRLEPVLGSISQVHNVLDFPVLFLSCVTMSSWDTRDPS